MMKILLRFLGDPRNADQRKRYDTIEQRRADWYMEQALVRRRAAILRGQVLSVFGRRQAEL